MPMARPGLRQSIVETVLVLAPAILLIYAIFMQTRFDPRWAFLDPIIAGEMSGDCCRIYFGFMSNIGALIWAGAASITLFTALLLLRIGKRPAETLCMAYAGILTGLLCIDDMFLVYEGLSPILSVPQTLTIGVYGLMTLSYLIICRHILLRGNVLLLLAALGFFGISALVDLVLPSTESIVVVAEDAAKFLGICAWAGFHIMLAYRILAPRPQERAGT